MKQPSDENIDKLETQLTILNDYENTTNEEYGRVVLGSLNILLELTDSLHKDQIKLPSWKLWCEPIIFKFCYHVGSLIRLYSGTELPFKKDGKNIIIFDEPSTLILFRTVLENYLTFFYLFNDNISEEEKEFRMLVWRYCGLIQRSEFIINTKRERQKQLNEVNTLDKLRIEVSNNLYFKNYSKKSQLIILKGHKPRLFETWKSLINKSNLTTDIFQNIYGYKSNYSHTEFISILQIREGAYGHNKENKRSHHNMFLLHGVIAKLIIDLKSFLPSVSKHFENKDLKTRLELLCLSELNSNPKMSV